MTVKSDSSQLYYLLPYVAGDVELCKFIDEKVVKYKGQKESLLHHLVILEIWLQFKDIVVNQDSCVNLLKIAASVDENNYQFLAQYIAIISSILHYCSSEHLPMLLKLFKMGVKCPKLSTRIEEERLFSNLRKIIEYTTNKFNKEEIFKEYVCRVRVKQFFKKQQNLIINTGLWS